MMGPLEQQTGKQKKREKEPAEKPVSLAPLEFEEALRGLVKIKPAARQKAAPKS